MDLRSFLELLLFDGQKQRQKVGSLSGGERARVALAKVLRQGANLLVFDEPTNDLDLQTLSALEELLEGYDGSVIVVTHDRAFLDRVATAILAFEVSPHPGLAVQGGQGLATVTRYAGGYQDYVAQRARRGQPSRPAPPLPAQTSSPPQGAKQKGGGLTYSERLELDTIVEKIDAAERGVAALEAELADPSLYATRGADVAELQARHAAAREEAARLAARWEVLEAKKG
jgi:ATP-binding cassette subfamily F protein uup